MIFIFLMCVGLCAIFYQLFWKKESDFHFSFLRFIREVNTKPLESYLRRCCAVERVKLLRELPFYDYFMKDHDEEEIKKNPEKYILYLEGKVSSGEHLLSLCRINAKANVRNLKCKLADKLNEKQRDEQWREWAMQEMQENVDNLREDNAILIFRLSEKDAFIDKEMRKRKVLEKCLTQAENSNMKMLEEMGSLYKKAKSIQAVVESGCKRCQKDIKFVDAEAASTNNSQNERYCY
jgi:hypothetical protein